MIDGAPIIDADSHKCENPVFFFDYIPKPYRDRISLVRDRYGEQRFCFRDFDASTGRNDLERVFLQIDGYGKGTYRPYHRETTLGGLFNHIRIEHMDREGIDHQVIYGSIPLSFGSLVDRELAVVLCRAWNDYICDDTRPWAHRLHPVGVLPLQDPAEAAAEARRCVLELGMAGVMLAPNQPVPHPDAPERFPAIRVPKPLSHPDFHPIYRACEDLDVAIGLHGAPGVQLAGGTSDQLDTFTLVHVFANRSMQQMALARLIFDGVFDAFPRLRFGFLEAGAGWLPDLLHSFHEHWEKRIAHFDPSVEPSPLAFLRELARERGARGTLALLSHARRAISTLDPGGERADDAELEAFRYEHPALTRDPLEFLEEGRIFLTVEPDDPCPPYLASALGAAGERVAGLAVDYGHWDATLEGCVGLVADNPAISRDHAVRLLSTNALAFYGERLRARMRSHGADFPVLVEAAR
jgi:predicted TIM-barrel fold metal-dependent hydrolase